MAYPDPLDPATPGDGNFVGQGDDRIRELKRALIQRLSSFFVNVDADPLVPKDGSIPIAAVPAVGVVNTKLATFFIDITAATLVPKPNSIPQNAIQGGATPEGGTSTASLVDGSVTEPKLATGAVSHRAMAVDAVEATNIKDGEVGTPELGAGAVTLGKINSAVKALITVHKTGTLALTQAQTTLATGTYREYDVVVAGAKANRPAFAQWENATYPSSGGAPVAGNPGWQPGDGIRLQAWCHVDGFVRIRLVNLTGGSLDMGAAGATVTATVLNRLDDEP